MFNSAPNNQQNVIFIVKKHWLLQIPESDK